VDNLQRNGHDRLNDLLVLRAVALHSAGDGQPFPGLDTMPDNTWASRMRAATSRAASAGPTVVSICRCPSLTRDHLGAHAEQQCRGHRGEEAGCVDGEAGR
jgi:hypothetical protein